MGPLGVCFMQLHLPAAKNNIGDGGSSHTNRKQILTFSSTVRFSINSKVQSQCYSGAGFDVLIPMQL